MLCSGGRGFTGTEEETLTEIQPMTREFTEVPQRTALVLDLSCTRQLRSTPKCVLSASEKKTTTESIPTVAAGIKTASRFAKVNFLSLG